MKTVTNTNWEVPFPLVMNPKWEDTLQVQSVHYIRQALSRILNKMSFCSYLLTSLFAEINDLL